MERIIKKYQIVFSFSVLLALLLFLSGNLFASEHSIKTVTLHVEGMKCPMCPASVKSSISKLQGIKDVKVSLKDAVATVSYEEGKVTVDQIIKAVEGAGFSAHLIKE